MRRLTSCLVLLLPLVVLPASLRAQSPAPACTSAEYRQFDFWVGEWEVVDTAGRRLGTNRITREQNDCVLHEQWTSAAGGTGASFNVYDRASGRWHQTWVDSGGTLLLLDGALRSEGVMVLEGETAAPGGGTQRQRITWTRNGDGTVRQQWESSSDGRSWRTVFDGTYRRVK